LNIDSTEGADVCVMLDRWKTTAVSLECRQVNIGQTEIHTAELLESMTTPVRVELKTCKLLAFIKFCRIDPSWNTVFWDSETLWFCLE